MNNRYNLEIYEIISYNEQECVEILLEDVSHDEVDKILGTKELKVNQYYLVDELDNNKLPNGQSWIYSASGIEVDYDDICKEIGIEEECW